MRRSIFDTGKPELTTPKSEANLAMERNKGTAEPTRIWRGGPHRFMSGKKLAAIRHNVEINNSIIKRGEGTERIDASIHRLFV